MSTTSTYKTTAYAEIVEESKIPVKEPPKIYTHVSKKKITEIRSPFDDL
ncbi:hypothetical protein [Cyclobacterium jeungdonense]|nr:hypothetical protein [Cyclobacterium jeungdonense]